MTTTPTYLTPADLSERYSGRVSVKTLANWRSTTGVGPKFMRIGGKIFYRLDDIEAWERSNTYKSTADFKASVPPAA